MSATIGDVPMLAKWLDAAYYETDYRPVELSQRFAIGSRLYDAQTMQLVRELDAHLLINNDVDNVVG